MKAIIYGLILGLLSMACGIIFNESFAFYGGGALLIISVACIFALSLKKGNKSW